MCDSILLKSFFRQLFDIGRSAGSLVTEALGLFRTFQKLTATSTFTMRFSEESLKMFKWAIDILELIRHKFFFRPLEEYDLFYLYSCIIPLMLMTFITALLSGYAFYSYILGYGMIFMLGAGLCFIGINIYMVITLIPCGFLYILIALCCGCVFPKCRFCKKDENYEDEDQKNMDCWCKYCAYCCCKCNSKYNAIQFTYSLSKSILIMTIFLIPLLQISYKLTVLYGLVVIVILVLSMIIESIVALVRSRKNVEFDKLTNVPKFIDLCLSFFSLLIIPSTEHFMNLVTGMFDSNWRIICCYIFYSLIVPIGLTVIMITMKFDSILGKYKKCSIAFVYIFEIGEIVKQIAFAVVAAFDIPFACIALEIVWIIVLIIFRPFHNISDYFLQFGGSLIVIIELSVCISYQKKGSGFLSYSVTWLLLVLACIPAISALYVYFIFDFTVSDDDDDDENKEAEKKAYNLGLIIKVVSPIAWLFLPFLFFFYFFPELQPKYYIH